METTTQKPEVIDAENLVVLAPEIESSPLPPALRNAVSIPKDEINQVFKAAAIISRMKNYFEENGETADEKQLDGCADQIKKAERALEKSYKQSVAPFNQMTKGIREYFKGIREPAEKLRGQYQQQMRKLENQRLEAKRKEQEEIARIAAEEEREAKEIADKAERERQAALEKLQKADDPAEAEALRKQAAAQQNISTNAAQQALNASTKANNIAVQPVKVEKVRETRTSVSGYNVIDKSLIPSEYFMLNDRAIKDALRADRKSVPGIEAVETTTFVYKNK